MKKFLLLIAGVLIFSCSKGDSEFENLISNNVTVPQSNAVFMDSKESLTYDDNDYVESKDKGSVTVIYNLEKYNYGFNVTYHLLVNENHPKGYVIIDKIIAKKDDLIKVYTISCADDPTEYILTIHKHDCFTAKIEGEIVSLYSDEGFRGDFRTSESMIMAYWKTGDKEVTEEDVKKAADRMEGRKYGNKL